MAVTSSGSAARVGEPATRRRTSKFSAASHHRVHGWIPLCEILATRAAMTDGGGIEPFGWTPESGFSGYPHDGRQRTLAEEW